MVWSPWSCYFVVVVDGKINGAEYRIKKNMDKNNGRSFAKFEIRCFGNEPEYRASLRRNRMT